MRSDAYVRVECDKCDDPGMAEEIELCALVRNSYDMRNVDGALKQRGWKVEDGKDICPNCCEEEGE